ncbi:MAG: hypothetical protein AB1529_02435 [Candidatus Micrarchaeota archaeon]
MSIGPREALIVFSFLLLSCLAAAGFFSYLTYRSIGSSVRVELENVSFDAARCHAGDKGYMDVFGTKLNFTVQGIESWRGRQACRSSGTASAGGEGFALDIYRVEEGDQCAVLTSSKTGESSEDCDGLWPGYAAGH